ncbi:hypothetical protein Gotur_004978 [Gossypium turneri]
MENIEYALPQIRAKLKIFYWKDIYNMDETGLFYHKVPLWVISKFANPRCFKHVNLDNLSCHYRANKTAWMIGLLFKDFVRWFDARMTGRKVLLTVDNCPSYPKQLRFIINAAFILTSWNVTRKEK